MSPGLFLRREWVTSIRSLRLFRHRWIMATMSGLCVGGLFLGWDWIGRDRSSVAGASRFGLWLFGTVTAFQACLSFQLLTTLAPSIAGERDRKCLDALLATRLESSQIILGNLAAGLVRYLNSLAATIPIVVLIVTLGGVPLGLVLLAHVCLASMVFSMAALSVAVSACSRSAALAVNAILGIDLFWMVCPWLFVVLKPILWRGGPSWPVTAALHLMDGSPLGLWMNLMGVIPRPNGLAGAVLRLVCWQVGAGLGFVAWAIVRLRPASRAVYDLEGRTSSLWLLPAALRRPHPRATCGDDPVLWNELYVLRGHSRLGRIAGRWLSLGSCVLLAIGTSWFAVPAFAELKETGYVASTAAFAMPEFNPFIRVIVSKFILRSPLPPQPGQARLEFNIVLRHFSLMTAALLSIGILAAVARSVTAERRRDTWLGLVATPLSGREILGAKMIGAILNTRETSLLLVVLWTTGLLSGAVHPLGFLAASISLAVCAGLAAALGVATLSNYRQLESSEPAVGPVRLLGGIASSLLVLVVPTFLIFASLLSYEDVAAAARGGAFPQFGAGALKDLVGVRGLMAAWLLTTLALAALAIVTARSVFRGFDAAIGRPVRARSIERPTGRVVAVLPAVAEA